MAITTEQQDTLKRLPKVDALLAAPEAAALLGAYSRDHVLDAIRVTLDGRRAAILAGESVDDAFAPASILSDAATVLSADNARNLRRVINATGIVLHTNLGRAPMAASAVEAAAEVGRGYSNLEFDLESGKRGSRMSHIEALLGKLTGAEAALVVNNNAAAVMLAVNTLAKDAEVVTSRGELIEIGGSFRIPDVVERSEADLVEVGTTNKTRVGDFEQAITDRTRILLKVHPSNYKIVGFTGAAEREELVALAGERGLVFVEDLGSGCLVDFGQYGVHGETTVREVVEAGVDVVTFSGDKLLGGPQAGIVVGREGHLAAMRRNPLMRALRPDKMTLAALEATLLLYLDEDRLPERLPILAALSLSDEALLARVGALSDALAGVEGLTAGIEDGESYSGGGSMPEEAVPTKLLSVDSARYTPDALCAALRACDPPIVARIAKDAVRLDVRTIAEDELAMVADALRKLHG